jgi:hypothetical protein
MLEWREMCSGCFLVTPARSDSKGGFEHSKFVAGHVNLGLDPLKLDVEKTN